MEATHCFAAAVMVLLLGKCCPFSPSFISSNRWNSEGAKSRPYSGCAWDSPAKIDNVLHSLQAGMEPGVTAVSEERDYLHLWPDSGSLSF